MTIYKDALRRGLSIHPLKPQSKIPVLNSWQTEARNSADVMDGQPADANFGVMACEKFCFLDIDDLREFRATISRELPDNTLVVQSSTPNKRHYYFRQTDASRALGNLKRPCFDFQQNNRYVVGPGSTHPDGAVYLELHGDEIIPIPDSLVAALERSSRSATGEKLPSAPDPYPGLVIGAGGGRHFFLARQAGKLFDGEIFEDEMFDRLMALDQQYCDPPKGEKQCRDLVEAAFRKWEPNKPSAHVYVKPLLVGHAVKGAPHVVLGTLGNEKVGLFGSRRLHLIQGSSGAGKTTLMLQMLKAQKDGETFFGRRTFGLDYLVVWQDRGEDDLKDQLISMELDQCPPPYAVVTAEQFAKGPAAAVEEIYLAQTVKPKVMYVEGLDMWCPDSLEMRKVVLTAREIRSVAEHYNLSVVASFGAPKQNRKERYQNVRDRNYGSSAWARLSGTVLDLCQDTEDYRMVRVSLMPRNSKPQIEDWQWDTDIQRLHHRPPAIVVGPVEQTVEEIREERGVSLSQAYRIKKKTVQ